MVKGREIIGLPVINLQNGKEVGIVHDLIFVPQSNLLQALLIKGSGFKGERLIYIEDVESIGEDAIMLSDAQVIKEMPPGEEGERIASNQGKIMGKKVLTSEGKELGKINDILLDAASKKFQGYEVSEGLIDDLLKGRSILQSNYHWKIGEDAIIIETEEGD